MAFLPVWPQMPAEADAKVLTAFPLEEETTRTSLYYEDYPAGPEVPE